MLLTAVSVDPRASVGFRVDKDRIWEGALEHTDGFVQHRHEHAETEGSAVDRDSGNSARVAQSNETRSCLCTVRPAVSCIAQDIEGAIGEQVVNKLEEVVALVWMQDAIRLYEDGIWRLESYSMLPDVIKPISFGSRDVHRCCSVWALPTGVQAKICELSVASVLVVCQQRT